MGEKNCIKIVQRIRVQAASERAALECEPLGPTKKSLMYKNLKKKIGHLKL